MSFPTREEMLNEAKHNGYVDASKTTETEILTQYYLHSCDWNGLFFSRSIVHENLCISREYAIRELGKELCWDAQENLIRGFKGSIFGELLSRSLALVNFEDIAQELIGNVQVISKNGKFVPDDNTDEKKIIDYFRGRDHVCQYLKNRVSNIMLNAEGDGKAEAVEYVKETFENAPLRVKAKLEDPENIDWLEVVEALKTF